MNIRRLGRSGLKVSELSLGTWTTIGGSVDRAEAIPIIRRAFELGVNLFDTADIYSGGKAEEVLGEALADLPRDEVIVATKCMRQVWPGPNGGGLSRKHIFAALDRSLMRLKVDYVDLYQLHAPDPDTPIEESVRAFEDLVRSGKVRYVGYSNYDAEAPPDARKILEFQNERGFDLMVSSQPRWNLIDRHIEKEHLALCRKWGVGLLVYSPLAQGVLTNKYAGGARPDGTRAASRFGKFMETEKMLTPETVAAAERFAAWVTKRGIGSPAQVALAWVLKHPEVASVLVGAASVAQLEENLKAGELMFTEGDWREVEAAIAGRVPAKERQKQKPKPVGRVLAKR
ncbi:MAG: aldo/keto reductase [Candidatus Eiseniibacteriota bacterium]